MSAAQAAESRHALRAACLFAVLVSAKALTLAGHHIPLSVWAPVAYLWQDVFVVSVFLVVDRGLRRPALAWWLYAIVVAYAALSPRGARALDAADVADAAGGTRAAG